MSAFQEDSYRGLASTSLDPQLLPGKISRFGEGIESTPITINGEETQWRIKGKYDLVVEYESGTIGLIDCKVTTSAMDDEKVNHYLPQLEAYCFALENPMTGLPEKVAHSGLMMWRVNGATQDEEEQNYFTTESAFLMIPRDPDRFQEFMARVIEVLEGPIPESGEKCDNCAFVEKRNLIDSVGVN
jgi:hypothetical protein